jgi:hypothetical protein
MGTGKILVRFAAGMVIGIAAVVVGLGAAAARVSSNAPPAGFEQRIGQIASRIAGKQVDLRCWSRSGWQPLLRAQNAAVLHRVNARTLGFADISGTRENLSPEVCSSLRSLVYGHVLPPSPLARLRAAQAIVTLAHEPQHSKGIAVEAQAECYAIQLARQTAVELGATPQEGASLQALYWSRYGDELPEYRSPECRDGGAYDLHPADPAFP